MRGEKRPAGGGCNGSIHRKIASPSQGVSYYEKDGYYAKDDPVHREASAWAGKGAEALGLADPVEPEAFRAIPEGEVSGGRWLNSVIVGPPGREKASGRAHAPT